MFEHNRLIEDIQDILGIEVTAIYGDERHFPEFEMVTAIAYQLLMAFSIELLGAKKIGEYTRSSIVTFVKNFRIKRQTKVCDNIQKDINFIIAELKKKRIEEVNEKFELLKKENSPTYLLLKELGISENHIKSINSKLVETIYTYMMGRDK